MATAEIIVRLVDEVTGPARRVQATLEALGASVRRINAATEGTRRISTNLREATNSAERLRSRLDAVHAAGQRVGAGLRRIGSGLVAAGMTGLAYQATKYGAALGFVRKELLSTQIEFENYRAELETTLRSTEKAKKAMDFASEFAFTTPFELPEVVKAMKLLAAGNMASVDDMTKLRRIMLATGDAASIMGKDYPYAIDAIRGVFAGRSDMFENLTGLNLVKKKDNWLVEYVNREGKLVKREISVVQREKGLKELIRTLEDLYKGGMARKAQTPEGMLSNYADVITRFKKMILDSGLGDEINNQLKRGLDYLDELSKPFKVKGPDNIWETHSKLSELAAQFSGILQNRLRESIELVRDLYEQIKRIADLGDRFANSSIGQAIGGWNGMIKGVLAVPFAKPVWDMAAGLATTAFNAFLAVKALRAIRALAPVAAVAAGATSAGATGAVASTAAAGGGVAALRARLAAVLAGGGGAAIAGAGVLAAIGGLFFGTKALMGEGAKNWKPADAAAANDLRNQIAELQARVDQIRSRSKMPEMADSLAAPLETQINDLKARLKVYEDEASKTGAAVKSSLDVTARPTIDTSGMDSAIAKARQFRSYMEQIGPTTPNGAGGGGGAAPTAAGKQANITVHVHGGRDGTATARKVASAVREAIDRTYGDGAYRTSMVG